MPPLTQGQARQDDPHLKDRLNQIAEKITSEAFLSGQGLGVIFSSAIRARCMPSDDFMISRSHNSISRQSFKQ